MHGAAASSQHPPGAFTLQEAAAVLAISLNTLRRRIEAGQVRAERVERPQGHVWRVYLDGGQHAGPVRGVV
jgi:excisionase family DNA binding protein